MSRRTLRKTSALSAADMHYLRANLDLSPDIGPTDPQAQRVYAAASNVIDLLAPVWTTAEVEAYVRAFAAQHGLRIRLCWRKVAGGYAFVGRGGGTIVLNAEKSSGEYRRVKQGEHIASLVLHELAHVLTHNHPGWPVRYNTPGIQPHGPEFVRCYLEVLAEHVDTRKAVAAYEFLGVDIAPAGEPCHQGSLPGCL